MTKWTCGDESVENFEDFSEATKQHIIDNIANALSKILSDKYDCKVTWTFEKKRKKRTIIKPGRNNSCRALLLSKPQSLGITEYIDCGLITHLCRDR